MRSPRNAGLAQARRASSAATRRCAQLPDGAELHYCEQGRGAAVILLHGGMGDLHSWPAQVEALAPQLRVIAYSRRHSSPNKIPPPAVSHTLISDVEDLLHLQRLLATGPCHLVGTSYGALVALAFALTHPAQVRRLVLAEPPLHRWVCRTPGGARLFEDFLVGAWHPAALAFDAGDERRAMQLLTDGMWGRSVFDAMPQHRQAATLRNAAAMRALTRSIDPFPDFDRAAVARLSMPTLLVHGEHTSAIHRRGMDELAIALRGALRVCIANAGHGASHENPQLFNEAILAFLLAPDRETSSNQGA